MTAIAGWENFYVIVGSSAGALIGLQFVVLMLITRMPTGQGDPHQASDAFATPSVVHFGVVLLLSAIMSAPWNGMAVVSALWGLTGLCGLIYVIVVARRMRAQKIYRPVAEDWLFHAGLPLSPYAMMLLSPLVTSKDSDPALFLVAAAALVLLFVGIHNAWDAVTYHVFTQKKGGED